MFTNLRERLSFYLGVNSMPNKTKAETKKSAKSKENNNQKEYEKKMSSLQRKICRDILDASDVTKSQVSSELIRELQGLGSSREDLKQLVSIVNNKIDTQTNQLVDRVVKAFE